MLGVLIPTQKMSFEFLFQSKSKEWLAELESSL